MRTDTAANFKAIVEEGFIHGLPIVMHYAGEASRLASVASAERCSVGMKLASVASGSGHRRAQMPLTESAPASSTGAF